jgi:riboflavin kinase/FMN adenylyltransferase
LALLMELARRFDFEVISVGEIQATNSIARRISSTKIRDLVMEGAVDDARRLLGRHYQIRGEVVAGRNRGGRQLGFPTANIQMEDELCPRNGIYAVMVELDGTSYPAVANIGYSPTFDDQLFTVEVYLMDFSGDLYGRHLRVNFVTRMRDEIRFDTLDELKAQIGRDVTDARQILAAENQPRN